MRSLCPGQSTPLGIQWPNLSVTASWCRMFYSEYCWNTGPGHMTQCCCKKGSRCAIMCRFWDAASVCPSTLAHVYHSVAMDQHSYSLVQLHVMNAIGIHSGDVSQ
eukprot:scpid82260/ scgid19006/ 